MRIPPSALRRYTARCVRVAAFGFIIASLLAHSAAAQLATGKTIAEQSCARCHIVAPGGGTGWTDAPTFQAIADRDGASSAKLSAFIQQPHLHMLDTARPPAEANALAAYIMSLRRQ